MQAGKQIQLISVEHRYHRRHKSTQFWLSISGSVTWHLTSDTSLQIDPIRCSKQNVSGSGPPPWIVNLSTSQRGSTTSNICQANAEMITTAARTRGIAVMPRCSLKPWWRHDVNTRKTRAIFCQGHKLGILSSSTIKQRFWKSISFAKLDPQMLESRFESCLRFSVNVRHPYSLTLHYSFAQRALAAFPYYMYYV